MIKLTNTTLKEEEDVKKLMKDQNRDRVIFHFYEPRSLLSSSEARTKKCENYEADIFANYFKTKGCVKRFQQIRGSDSANKSDEYKDNNTDLKETDSIKSVN